MPEAGEQVELMVEKLVYGGQGLGRLDKMAVFVPRVVPGEKVKVRIVKARRDYAVGELVEVIDPSLRRVPAPCPYYEHCGGCQLQHLSYEDQLQAKTDQVRETLERIGAFPSPPVRDILPAEKPFGYRNKASYHLRVSEGRLLIGLVGVNRGEIVDLSQCPLQPEGSNRVLAHIRDALNRHGLPKLAAPKHENRFLESPDIFTVKQAFRRASFDPNLFRHLVIRTSEATDQAMVVLVLAQREFPGKEPLIQELEREKEGIDSCMLNVNPRLDYSVLGDEYEPLWGPSRLLERVDALEFEISPAAFFQVNTRQAERLVEVIRKYAALTDEETVLDLYSGVGLFSLALAGCSRLVYGVELSREATLDAIRNAELNGITDCSFRSGKAERLMQKLFIQGYRPQVAILDPPRGGCHPKVLEFLPKMGVRRVLYISCSPPTLARDLKALDGQGYRLQEVQPLDMFPQTYHVECVALLRLAS